jgi:beta-phosphoglucomutase-like phosphatase (HAD superfamily)
VVAGAEPRAWNDAFDRLVPDLSCGRITMAQAFEQILAACGVRPDPVLISALADAIVLSCEVGCAKPDARIYRHALAQLGVTASGAVFIDDQPANCAAAAVMGMTALQIARGTAQPLPPAPCTRVIGSLLEAL